MIKSSFLTDLDNLFVEGKISEDEYLSLATDDINVLAVAEDTVDGITTVSLSKENNKFTAEVLYPLDQSHLDEKFVAHESSLKIAGDNFVNKIKQLEKRGHEFEITWYFKRK